MVPDQNGELTKPDDDAAVSIPLGERQEWHPFRPRPEDFEWTDIAIGASRIPRFGGQLSPSLTSTRRRTTCWRSIFACPRPCA